MKIEELSEKFQDTYLGQWVKVGTDIQVENGLVEITGQMADYDNFFVYLGANAIKWDRIITVELADMEDEEMRNLLNLPTSEKVS
jgi:hypothetical protein